MSLCTLLELDPTHLAVMIQGKELLLVHWKSTMKKPTRSNHQILSIVMDGNYRVL